jgi:hypothetical protein
VEGWCDSDSRLKRICGCFAEKKGKCRCQGIVSIQVRADIEERSQRWILDLIMATATLGVIGGATKH